VLLFGRCSRKGDGTRVQGDVLALGLAETTRGTSFSSADNTRGEFGCDLESQLKKMVVAVCPRRYVCISRADGGVFGLSQLHSHAFLSTSDVCSREHAAFHLCCP
jgi:hypothetical protein